MNFFRDWRVWLGFGITGLCLWLALRDVEIGAVGRVLADANWALMLGVAVPAHLGSVILRALRWRILTDPIQRIPNGPLFRATFIGFMANNLLPLRMGEFLRAWALSRETRASAAKLFGTVVFERVIDVLCFVVMMVSVLALHRFGDSSTITPRDLALLSAIAVGGLVAVRFFPEWFMNVLRFFLRPLPTHLAEKIEALASDLMEGLVSLRGWSAYAGLVLYSAILWALAALPFYVGLKAVGVDIEPLQVAVLASFATLVAVGVFIATPSAPGFFGTYHLACQFALATFGVPKDQAFAVGVLAHITFWVPVTLIGLIVFARMRDSLSLSEAAAAQR